MTARWPDCPRCWDSKGIHAYKDDCSTCLAHAAAVREAAALAWDQGYAAADDRHGYKPNPYRAGGEG